MGMAQFGGDTAWKVQKLSGNLTRAYHWIGCGDGMSEAAMVLYPTRPRNNAGAYIIALSSAWQYDDVDYLVKQSAIAAGVLGMDVTGQTIHQIGSAIHDGLLDLIKCPPEPRWVDEALRGEVVAELEISQDGKTIMEKEIYSNEALNG